MVYQIDICLRKDTTTVTKIKTLYGFNVSMKFDFTFTDVGEIQIAA